MARKVEIGRPYYTSVHAMDEKMEENGANHEYRVVFVSDAPQEPGRSEQDQLAGHIKFQKGAIKVAGKNGLRDQDLIAIVIDRLRGFQSGPLKCRENAIAITKLEEAIHRLDDGTARRMERNPAPNLK